MSQTLIDLTGQTFGRLTVLSRSVTAKVGKGREARWACRCECGNLTEVAGRTLRVGETKSCGCWRRDSGRNNATHGQSKTPLYAVWNGMLSRCYNQNHEHYEEYGGRGILVTRSWHRFEPFYEWAMRNGYAKGLHIDRRDNNKGYSPRNCQFVTPKVNANNRRPHRPYRRRM